MVVTDLSRFNNNWYKPGASLPMRGLWYLVNATFFRTGNPFYGLKLFWLRLFGAMVGTGVVIKPYVNIKYPWNLSIGNHVWIGEEVWIDNLARVTIGNNVCISQGAVLLTGNHNYKKSTFDLMTGEITLEDGVWVGAKSMVVPGVTCRSHSVLSVMSVAVNDLEPYAIYHGNPALKVRDRIIE